MIGSGTAFTALEKISKSLEVLQKKEKIVVQIGQCSHAVGAQDYIKSIVDNFSQTYEILEGGCDGACFAAPRATCRTPARRLARGRPPSPHRPTTPRWRPRGRGSQQPYPRELQ